MSTPPELLSPDAAAIVEELRELRAAVAQVADALRGLRESVATLPESYFETKGGA